MIYFPIAVIITIYFTIGNIIIAPFAYVFNTFRQIKIIFLSPTLAKLKERIILFFTMIMITPFILVLSIPANMFVFFWNLYTSNKEGTCKDKENCESNESVSFDTLQVLE